TEQSDLSMLSSKRAKQPDHWALLGSSHVMKHLRLVLILALVAAFAAACGGSDTPKSVPSDAVAVVGGDTISKERFNAVLDQAKRSYAAQHKSFPKPGTAPYGTVRAQIIQFLVERSEYEQPAQPESRDVRHILVKSHALALTVYHQLKAGGDFSKLALKYSIDPSKTTGGRLTVCKQKTVSCPLKTVAPFEKAAFSLKTNEISKPVHTQFGWHVIQPVGPVNPPKKASSIPF